MHTLYNKVAIVTGTTAESIGRACAMSLAMQGTKVVVTGRKEEGGKETEKIIKNAGGECIYIKQDVTIENDWKKVIEKTIKKYNRLDFLVNNAGEAIVKPIEKLTYSDLKFLRSVDLDGPFMGIKYSWPHMVEAGGGVILNMSSIVGQKGNPRSSAYSAIKGAQLGLTRSCAMEGALVNIRVNSIHPGMIWTAGVPDVLGPDAEEKKPSIAARIPWGETGESHHVGDAVAFLCSSQAKYITGVEFNIDGGAGAT